MTEKSRENKIRRTLEKYGYQLHKSRTRNINAYDFGEYMVTDLEYNAAVFGDCYDATLDDIAEWLAE